MALIESLHRPLDRALALAPLRTWIERQERGAFVANRDRNLFYGNSRDVGAGRRRPILRQEGSDHPASAGLYDHRLRMDPHDYPSLYWLSRSLQEGMKGVFDVGGAIRIKFLAFRALATVRRPDVAR